MLARGILDALRILSGGAPLVIAVDDAQWLDRPSAGVLEFCFRRLQNEPVSILLTFRDGRAGPARPGPGAAAGSPWPGAAGSAEPGRDRRDPAVTAGGGAAPVRPHPAVRGVRRKSLLRAGMRSHARRAPAHVPTNEPIPVPRSLSDLVRSHVVAYLRDVLAGIGTPVILVGHSYGGMVITEAAAGP